jgi:hypothetical protein
MDKQTGKFIASVVESLPKELDENLMQGWIENPKGLQKVLREALCPPAEEKKWFEKDGMIYFTVISNGMSGKEWIKHFESKGIKIGDYARQILLKIKPSKKGTVTQIAVIKGEFFSDENRTTSKIREEANKRKLSKPNTEVACLIRDMFTDGEIKEMGLWWIVTIHEPIITFSRDLGLLCTYQSGGRSRLDTGYSKLVGYWDCEAGFAFVASQV